ncbi:MAG: glycosyltransferase family 39 protein [Anaerolineales bacterium]|nr:MAG: glycosyltransferase family 39 protein [Anaerolineales bacterium]
MRLYNIAWDDGTLPHPDERSTVAFYAPSIRWPGSLSAALDPRQSSLNPFWDVRSDHRRSYTYGHFPLYTLVLTAGAAERLAPLADSLGLPQPLSQTMAEARSMVGYAYIGRFLVAMADTFTVYLVFLLGRRLYGAWAGLLAAAFSAFTVLQIQLAHFFAVDPISTTFTLLALYGAIRIHDRPSAGAAALTGVGIGLAVASKYSALPIVAAPLVAILFAVARSDPLERKAARRLALGNLLVVGLVSFVVFAVTSPFVLLDFESFWQAVVREQGDMVSGVADFPFTRQYRGTPAYIYFIVQQIRWGMGWPLGLLAFAGLAWVLARAILGRASPGEWILLSWVILYFGPTGLFLAKFMRYMVPVVPLFVLFGAGLASSVSYQTSNQRVSPLLPGLPRLASYAKLSVAFVALLGAMIWSLAFVNGVYGTPHSWITASRWVYEHVPDGSCIAVEHWEEGFPRAWAEPGMNPGAHNYRQPLLPMYEPDTRQKFETIRDTLQDCDYLALASNRLWRTIPRLPQRYPLSTAYYRALFDGSLGFEEVYHLDTPPRLGVLAIDDQAADESFTVYDHPRPIIFKKTRQLSDAEWEALLGNRWQEAVHGYVGQPTLLTRLRGMGREASGPTSNPPDSDSQKSLLLDRPVDELPVVDDYHWNSLANRSALVAILTWWLAIQLIGWLAWPLAQRLFYRLPDRGYLLSKGLGWLLVGYGVWLTSSLRLLRNALPTIIGALVVLGGVAFWLLSRHPERGALYHESAPSPTSGKRNRVTSLFFTPHSLRLILAGEVIFGLVYLCFVGLRLLNPDLWQPWNGGEKMLEIGFLTAIVKSAHMPPYDPYFAGGHINYYYYGLFLVGVLAKLTGIQPTIAFNLAVPTLAALTAGGVFSLGYNLAHRPRARESRALLVGVLAVGLVILVGNLAGFTQLIRMLGEHSGSAFESGIPGLEATVRALAGLKSIFLEGTKLPTYNYWDPSRAIPDTINEFPYWSFLFADLHPHMIGIPFTVLFLSLAYTWLRPASFPTRNSQRPGLSAEVSKRLQPTSPLDSGFPPETSPLPVGLARQLGLEALDFLRELSWGTVFRWLALPFCLGALATINTWDLPTYLGVITLTFWLVRYRRGAQEASQAGRAGRGRLVVFTLEALLFGALTLAVSYLLYLPFFAHYQPLDVGLGLVRDKTDLGQFVKIWGLPLFVVISHLLLVLAYPASRLGALRTVSLFLRRWNVAPHLSRIFSALVRPTGAVYWAMLWSLVVVAGLGLGLWLLDYRVPGLLLPLVWLSFLFLLRPEPDTGQAFVGLLVFTGLLILLGVEFFFLRDFLGGSSYYRMNTLFKFYIQVWVMLGVASAYLLVALTSARSLQERAPQNGALMTVPPVEHWRGVALGLVWRAVTIALFVAVLAYPALGTPSRVRDRFDRSPPIGTLDGMAYMTTGTLVWPQGNSIQLKYDYQAIRWLQENVKGTPVLAEAKIGYYREGGMRVTSYTGLPMPLGGLHQNEQRWPAQVGQRDGLYMEFWNSSDPVRAWELIQELDISYIYIGQLERTLYDPNLASSLVQWGVPFLRPDGFSKFGELAAQGRLAVAYENERVRIYKVAANE